MRLEALKIHQLGTFRDFAVDLEKLGDALLVAIVGPNGAGKSTMLELAVPGALYRECPTRGSLQDLAQARDSFVESRLTNGSTYTIRHLVDSLSGKGETLVFDAEGKPVLSSTSVKAFDAWAAKHLPSPEVLYASVFNAQASAGFLGAKPGPRKAILLRTLGIERYESLAEKARKHALETKVELETLRIRIEDEKRRGGIAIPDQHPRALEMLGIPKSAEEIFAGIEREIAALEEAAAGADAALENARGALNLARSGAPALEMARREAAATRQKRGELKGRIATKRTELDQTLLRIRNNSEVLQEASAIRAAKETYDALSTEIARLGEELKAAEDRRLAAVRERDQHAYAERAAESREAMAARRAREARAKLADRARAQAAADAVPDLERKLAAARAAMEAADAALEDTRGQRLAGADDRIVVLRGGLQAIADVAEFARSDCHGTVARKTLEKDDAMVRAAAELPAKLRAAEDAARTARDAHADAQEELGDARALAAQLDGYAAVEREAVQAETDAKAAQREAAEAALARENATTSMIGHEQARGTAQEKRAKAQRDQAGLAELAKKATPLATAEGRLAELKPQATRLQAEVDTLEAELAAIPEPPETPAPPDVADLERREAAAAAASKGAAEAVGLARGRLERARESARAVTELEAEAARVADELADWKRLGDDLGRDGLQALEIDAAGPELTELTNDLLRTCFGPRWTVSIDTTRPDSTGLKRIECCEVRVLDTEAGREAEASTYSGGERVLLGEALSLALTMVACRRSGLRGVTLIRDESGAALSPENGRAYIAMLRRAAELVGASRVLFVTHVPELAELADARIDVGAGGQA